MNAVGPSVPLAVANSAGPRRAAAAISAAGWAR
jgi:hypothetical protein